MRLPDGIVAALTASSTLLTCFIVPPGSVQSGAFNVARLADDREQFRHTEEVCIGSDLAAHALIWADVALKFRYVPTHAEHQDQVTARAPAPHTNVVGVERVLRGVRPEPADRRLAVVDLRGLLRLTR